MVMSIGENYMHRYIYIYILNSSYQQSVPVSLQVTESLMNGGLRFFFLFSNKTKNLRLAIKGNLKRYELKS